jgi:DNA-binding NarL/FixJ family response regulator
MSANGIEACSVAVFARVPLYRRGLAFALREVGFDVHEPHDLSMWLRGTAHGLAVMVLHAAEDWRLLRRLKDARPDSLLIAILPDSQPQSFERALTAGASTAVPEDVEEEQICDVVCAAARGNAVLPATIVRLIADGNESNVNAGDLTVAESAWLSALAHGSTVTELAHEVGYSEREMYRLLQGLYRRLGARTRGEALVAATRYGLIS